MAHAVGKKSRITGTIWDLGLLDVEPRASLSAPSRMDNGGNIWHKKGAASKLGAGSKRVAAAYGVGIVACIVAGSYDGKRVFFSRPSTVSHSSSGFVLLIDAFYYSERSIRKKQQCLRAASLLAERPRLVGFPSHLPSQPLSAALVLMFRLE